MVDPTRENEPDPGSSKSTNSSKRQSKGIVASLEEGYEGFIELGKRKLRYYDPDVTDDQRFLMSFLIYFMFLLMVVFVADYLAQKTYEDSDSLGPLQNLEVEIVYTVQKDYFDMPVYVNRTSKTIWYDTTKEWNGQNFTADERIGGFGLQIDSVCTGFHEMVFLGVLVLGFRGVPFRMRAKWTAILLGIVFVENLFRIFALYPLALYKGRDFEDWFHYYWWHYGQYAFIMLLFGLWFFFVARNYIHPDEQEKSGKDKVGDTVQGRASETSVKHGGKRTRQTREAAFMRYRENLETDARSLPEPEPDGEPKGEVSEEGDDGASEAKRMDTGEGTGQN